VLVTGGDLAGAAIDVLHVRGHAPRELVAPRVAGGPVHGTGCTLSAAIAARLAVGMPIDDAVTAAKAYVTRAIADAAALGHGSRLLAHHVAVCPDPVRG
jgi:hydroxymethylpyrimidine/phosphomethylpyrimidine kinase